MTPISLDHAVDIVKDTRDDQSGFFMNVDLEGHLPVLTTVTQISKMLNEEFVKGTQAWSGYLKAVCLGIFVPVF